MDRTARTQGYEKVLRNQVVSGQQKQLPYSKSCNNLVAKTEIRDRLLEAEKFVTMAVKVDKNIR